jgi:ubiquinone/menaquinone biosynthesis C-methylase UbiE
MGYVSLEFLKRGVRVTATDLTPRAVEITRRHLECENVHPEEVRVENALELSFKDETFDAVWSNGVIHATGNPQRAIDEVWRVLKPNGRAIISHFYRRPSWMYYVSRFGRENIEYKDEDPPINDFLTEKEIVRLFDRFEIVETFREHHRALPIARRGLKANLYTWAFRPSYNLLPEGTARRLAYKYSVIAIKK